MGQKSGVWEIQHFTAGFSFSSSDQKWELQEQIRAHKETRA